ncbi:MAG TPA: lipid-A-disaccharide synthase [Tahibacter sp.]|uniref:lipid-A-disaccharide synthase n=1 Tax=Tahibacter sp. TaxID=2056211 RepID=UPI002B74A0BA|nr:lipid-A-disaccharide synthase [Tahibacter sp.]HSX61244.1 lipid-A-disaccharide synthase [Tahibacter sp.]
MTPRDAEDSPIAASPRPVHEALPPQSADAAAPLFALVAGEASGDQLGAGLIAALRERHPGARFVGVGGPRMIAAGLEAWYPADRLAVMGLVEVLRHLPELLRIRADLLRRIAALKPAAFIGIDAPDFNLTLERKLKAQGIRTVHYVSPSIWAWRENRAAKIGRSADLVLCLFPMEPPIYDRYGVRAQFVGHPMADRFALVTDREPARAELGLSMQAPVLALLPGSRLGEIRRLGADFLQAARRCQQQIPNLQVIVPMATPACRTAFEQIADGLGIDLRSADPASRGSIDLVDGKAAQALLAADIVLVASGTAALEAMLAKRPMVVAYKVAPLTYAIVTWFKLMRTTRYSLPNVLAGRDLVPEILQDACTPQALADAVLALYGDSAARVALVAEFERLHRALIGDADRSAAAAVDALIAPAAGH